MKLIIPDNYKDKVASALGFANLDQAVASVLAMPLNEHGYADIRRNGAFITHTSNRNSYARVIVGGGKCGMAQDWAPAPEYLTERGRMIASGIAA